MERQRIVTLIIIISVFTIIVTITGASFAYFSSTFDSNKSTHVGAKTEAASPSFISTSSSGININVESYLMSEHTADNENTADELTDSANLSVFLTSFKDDVVTTCTYDIIFVWNDEADIYSKTTGALKEFTISASAQTDAEDKRPSADVPDSEKFEVTKTGFDERNIDTLDWQEKYIVKKGENSEYRESMRYAILVDDAKISSASLRNATSVKWNFNIRFYNIKLNQDKLRGKNYSGVIRVDQDSIKC